MYDDREYGQVPCLEAVATWNQEQENIVVFAVNRNTDAALFIEGDARVFSGYRVVEHITLTHPDLHACHTAESPNVIAPQRNGDARLEAGVLRASFPQASWNVIRLAKPH